VEWEKLWISWQALPDDVVHAAVLKQTKHFTKNYGATKIDPFNAYTSNSILKPTAMGKYLTTQKDSTSNYIYEHTYHVQCVWN